MNEADVKRRMVEVVKLAKGYARRFEDQFSVGFPDCIFILPDRIPCFAEIKMVQSNLFGPTPRQLVELRRIAASSTKVAACVVGYKAGFYYIENPQQQIDIREVRWSGQDFVKTLERYLS